MPNPYTVDSVGANVLIVRFTGVVSGWEQWFLLSSDRHHDNICCDRDLEKRHLEEVKERDALILDFGDLFCAMQGKYDPRASMDDIRPEDVGGDYLDRIVLHAAQDYGPYAANWLLLGKGNHESDIRYRNGVDLTSNLAHRLNIEYGGHVYVGGYGGWVRFLFQSPDNRVRSALNLKYHHGSGGGGPVTRGVIQTARQAVYLPDADVVVNGHTHDSWLVPIARERLSAKGRVGRDVVYFVRVSGYKNEYGDGSGGYHVERWGPPKPIGAMWMILKAVSRHDRVNIETNFIQAVT